MPTTHKKKKQKRKYKITKKISMDEIYRILNRVQINKKEAKFSVTLDESITVEHVIKDVDLPYDKLELKSKTTFIVKPRNDEEEDDPVFNLDFIDDEITEEGQLF